MTEWANMWRNYVNFSDRTNCRGYWKAWLVNFITMWIFIFLVETTPSLYLFQWLYGVAAILPTLGLCVRRLRDMGKAWQNIFLMLVPIAGPIILIYYFTRPSVPDDGIPVV